MASAPFRTVVRRLVERLGGRANPADAGLLARFAGERDEAAFAELVRRHGPMVLGVCRRILRDPHAADDAFQATFLVLARKAGRLDGRRPLACWLFTVARNLALNHRLAATRRRAREMEASAMRTAHPAEASWSDLGEVLDAELARLPEHYRAPLVLCHLQGLTHEAAARELGWPAGSLAKRLARGLDLLRERLAARGLAYCSAALASLIGAHAAAAVSPAVVSQLSRAAALHALGQTTAGLVSPAAADLARLGLPALALSRAKLTVALVLVLGVVGAGAAVLGHRPEPPADAGAAAEPPAPADPRDDDLRRRLARSVRLEKGIEPGTTLQDALTLLAQRSDLPLRLDDKAFAAAGLNAVQKRTVSLPRLILPLRTVLRLLLRQVEPLDGRVSSFRIEQGAVVLAPAFRENSEDLFPPGLSQRLFRRARSDREPYGMTLADALAHYGKQYGQNLVIDRKAFAAIGEADPDRYPLAGRGRDLPEEPCLLKVLNLILWQVDGPGWQSYLQVRDGAIAITAARSESAEAKALAAHREMLDDYWGMWTGMPRWDVRLREKIFLDKGIDPDTPLRDVLEYLSDRYDLTILIDEAAFAGAGIPQAGERAVQFAPQFAAVPTEKVLRQILDQVANETYTAGFVCRDGYIDIVPEHNQFRRQKPLEAAHLEALWDKLAARNEGAARLAARVLAQAPREALPYLKERLRPAGPPDRVRTARARKLVAELESEQFAVRERATQELEKLADESIAALRDRMAADPPLESAVRIQQILERLNAYAPRPGTVRGVRGVAVLEAIGTREARQVLEALAGGEPDALPTQAARAALERLRP